MNVCKIPGTCKECEWEVIEICVNPPLNDLAPYCNWDWWVYCTNPSCKYHLGDGVFQAYPDWMVAT